MTIRKGRVSGAAILSLLLLPLVSLSAEIIHLRSGRTVVGSIVQQDRSTLVVLSGNETIRLQKSDVARIQYPAGKDAEEKARLEELKRQNDLWLKELDEHLKRRASEETSEEEGADARRKEESSFFRDEILEEKNRRKKNAVWRSALLPGWGQFYKEEPRKGTAIAVAVPLLIGGAYYSRKAYVTASSDYDTSNIVYLAAFYSHHSIPLAYMNYSATSASRQNMIQQQNRAAVLVGLGLAAYLFGVGDAFFKEPRLNWDDEESRASVPQGSPGRPHNDSVDLASAFVFASPVPTDPRVSYDVACTWRF